MLKHFKSFNNNQLASYQKLVTISNFSFIVTERLRINETTKIVHSDFKISMYCLFWWL